MWLSEEGIAIATNRTLRELSADGKPVGTEKTLLTNTGLETEVYDQKAIKVSNDFIDFSKAKAITIKYGGVEVPYTMDAFKEEFGVMVDVYESSGVTFNDLYWENDDDQGDVCTSRDSGSEKGTYFICDFMLPGISIPVNIISIDFGETTTPIDPKYLPGVCLPVVELSTEPGVGSGAKLTSTECAALNDAFNDQMPIVCKCSLMGITLSVPMLYVNSPSTSSGYMGMSGVGDISLTLQDDGAWTALFTAKG